MSFTTPALDPVDGLKNTSAYITRPANETDARAQIQGVIDQVVEIVQSLIDELESTTSGSSGAQNVGSAAISDVTGSTVYDQIANLKSQIDSVSAGGLSAGIISDTAYFADDVVTGAKIADDSIDSNHYVDGSIDTAHIADGAVTGDKIASGAVDGSSLTAGSVTADQLASSAATEAKIGTGAVTTTKILDGNVTQAKLGTIQSITLDTGDTVTYDTTNNQLKLNVDGCTAVALAPIVFGTSATPPSGTFPKGTIYVQYS